MGAMASQITSLTTFNSTVYSGADQRKHQSSASLAFVWPVTGDQWQVNSPNKWPVTRKMFLSDDVIMRYWNGPLTNPRKYSSTARVILRVESIKHAMFAKQNTHVQSSMHLSNQMYWYRYYINRVALTVALYHDQVSPGSKSDNIHPVPDLKLQAFPLSRAVPGKFHGAGGHSQRNCLQELTDFHVSRAWYIVINIEHYYCNL